MKSITLFLPHEERNVPPSVRPFYNQAQAWPCCLTLQLDMNPPTCPFSTMYSHRTHLPWTLPKSNYHLEAEVSCHHYTTLRVPLFLLMQNLSSKDIASSDHCEDESSHHTFIFHPCTYVWFHCVLQNINIELWHVYLQKYLEPTYYI